MEKYSPVFLVEDSAESFSLFPEFRFLSSDFFSVSSLIFLFVRNSSPSLDLRFKEVFSFSFCFSDSLLSELLSFDFFSFSSLEFMFDFFPFSLDSEFFVSFFSFWLSAFLSRLSFDSFFFSSFSFPPLFPDLEGEPFFSFSSLLSSESEMTNKLVLKT
jgi:hypothetical protein